MKKNYKKLLDSIKKDENLNKYKPKKYNYNLKKIYKKNKKAK